MGRLALKLKGPELLSYWGNRVSNYFTHKSQYCNDISLPFGNKNALEYNLFRVLPFRLSRAYHIQRRLWREKLGKTKIER